MKEKEEKDWLQICLDYRLNCLQVFHMVDLKPPSIRWLKEYFFSYLYRFFPDRELALNNSSYDSYYTEATVLILFIFKIVVYHLAITIDKR